MPNIQVSVDTDNRDFTLTVDGEPFTPDSFSIGLFKDDFRHSYEYYTSFSWTVNGVTHFKTITFNSVDPSISESSQASDDLSVHAKRIYKQHRSAKKIAQMAPLNKSKKRQEKDDERKNKVQTHPDNRNGKDTRQTK